MLELTSGAGHAYLSQRLGCAPGELTLRELEGGVSNDVYLAQTPRGECVVKRALARLRVREDWFCTPERAWNEVEGLRALAELLPAGAVPAVLWEDRSEFLFAMESIPEPRTTLKSMLLAGQAPPGAARELGRWLAICLRDGCGEVWRARFPSSDVFDNLRLDPYYRFTAARHPDLAAPIHRLIEECSARRVALTHGDYSPKNILIAGSRMVLIDCEVIHYGDPSFDAAFMTNHLLLKTFHRPLHAPLYEAFAREFWSELGEPAWLAPAAAHHLGVLLLARIDGKSPVEYIVDENVKRQVRAAARELILHPPAHPLDAFR